MAKVEPSPPVELVRVEGFDPSPVLDRWKDAAGLAALKPGFCFSPGDDRLFALGWPHVRFVTDGMKEDREPAASATRVLCGVAIPHRFVWPRQTAFRMVRALGAPAVFELQPLAKELRPEALEALWTEDPLQPNEVVQVISARLVTEAAGMPERAYPTLVMLLEALVGTELVANTLVDLLEAMPPNMLLGTATGPAQMTAQLGFLLLRLPVAQSAALRERLHAVLERVLEQNPSLKGGLYSLGYCHARALRLVLGGAAAPERDSDRSPRWYVHAVDDPQIVRRRIALNRLTWTPDPRLAWIAGPTVLKHFTRDVRALNTPDEQRVFLRQIAPMRAPEMLPLMLELAAHSLVRGEAQEWLTAHRDVAEPFLVEHAKTGAVAEAALRALRKAAQEPVAVGA